MSSRLSDLTYGTAESKERGRLDVQLGIFDRELAGAGRTDTVGDLPGHGARLELRVGAGCARRPPGQITQQSLAGAQRQPGLLEVVLGAGLQLSNPNALVCEGRHVVGYLQSAEHFLQAQVLLPPRHLQPSLVLVSLALLLHLLLGLLLAGEEVKQDERAQTVTNHRALTNKSCRENLRLSRW